MSIAYLAPNPIFQEFDDVGNPLVGGQLYTYQAGTVTPLASYTDATGTSANTNPIILDANGEASVWLAPALYKFILYDANGVEQWSKDSLQGVGYVSGGINYWGGTSAGSANAQTITTTTAFTSYTTPLFVSFIAGYTNTAAMTININGIGSKNVFREGGAGAVALTGGEIVQGNIYTLAYDGTQFQVINSNVGFPGQEKTIASATTTNIAGNGSNAIAISGTTTITSFGSSGSAADSFYFIRFTGALTLTNGSTLVLPNGGNIETSANDSAIFQDLGSAVWLMVEYTPAASTPNFQGGSAAGTANALTLTGSFSYSVGATVNCKLTATNTGAATLTIGSGTTYNIFKSTLTGPIALVGNEMVSGNMAVFQFDGTQFQLLSTSQPPQASLKAWGAFSGGSAGVAPTMVGNTNLVSIVRSSTGVYVITIATGILSDTSYGVNLSLQAGAGYSGPSAISPLYTINSTTSLTVNFAGLTVSVGGVSYDVAGFTISIYHA